MGLIAAVKVRASLFARVHFSCHLCWSLRSPRKDTRAMLIVVSFSAYGTGVCCSRMAAPICPHTGRRQQIGAYGLSWHWLHDSICASSCTPGAHQTAGVEGCGFDKRQLCLMLFMVRGLSGERGCQRW